MARRSPEQARFLGLWTAAWLFALLLAGVLRFGDLRVQWPVLLLPVLWALVALRPRARGRGRARARADDPPWPPPLTDERPAPGVRFPQSLGPGTREQPWLPEVPPPASRHPRQE